MIRTLSDASPSSRPAFAAALLAGLLTPLAAGPASAQGASLQSVGSTPGRSPRIPEPNAPTILVDLPEDLPGYIAGELTFQVSAEDPQGDLVSLRLLNPPVGLIFHPLVAAVPGTPSTVHWRIPSEAGGLHTLVFEANDDVQPQVRVRRKVRLRVDGQALHKGLVVGDVTGDGVLDVVATARLADPGTVLDAGAVYVWAGSTTPQGTPTAMLSLVSPAPGDLLGDIGHYGQGLQLADVTGDGILDVIAGCTLADVAGVPDAGAVLIWAGGSQLAGSAYLSPTATLSVTNPQTGSLLGSLDDSGQGIQIADVSGDGLLDLVVAAPADPDHANGAIHLWFGGAGLSGTVTPSATLVLDPTNSQGVLGWTAFGQGVRLADVSGDGVLDVVAGVASFRVYPSGPYDQGALCVWRGGAQLGGVVDVDALLRDPSGESGDMLGLVADPLWTPANGFLGLIFDDVTGDGQTDVIAGASRADRGGSTDAGAVYVWAGGTGLSGWKDPTAVLAAPQYDMRLGFVGSGQGIQVAEVSGDTVPDILVGASRADQGQGAVFVWLGGPDMTGTPPFHSKLIPPLGLGTQPALCEVGSGQGFQTEDVTGDSILDVVAAAPMADAGGQFNAGAVFVWAGGVGLSVGTLQPTASLTVSGAANSDQLGRVLHGQGVQLADLTGNGVVDVLALAPEADVGGTSDAGALYLWEGGSALSGTCTPLAELIVPGAGHDDRLGFVGTAISTFKFEFVPGVQLADVSGDGVLDVVAGAPGVDSPGLSDTGAVYVWCGGGSLSGGVAPTATLSVPTADADDQLGRSVGASDWYNGQELAQMAIQLADVNGDGELDIVAAAPWANVSTGTDAGAVYVWSGGATLTGSLPPSASLALPTLFGDGRLGTPLVLADVTGDGVLDVVAAAVAADVSGVTDAGALVLWSGAALATAPPPTAVWTVPGAALHDMLGH